MFEGLRVRQGFCVSHTDLVWPVLYQQDRTTHRKAHHCMVRYFLSQQGRCSSQKEVSTFYQCGKQPEQVQNLSQTAKGGFHWLQKSIVELLHSRAPLFLIAPDV